ncbi:MAG: hypothetical protein IPO78_16505 [Saprospiraceae bacterium]|nr:hypothetical protein [Saprospiraceae bacterium]
MKELFMYLEDSMNPHSARKNQTIVSKIDLLGIKFPNVILPFEDIYFMNGYAKLMM